MSMNTVREILSVVSAWQGMPLNYATIGKQLNITDVVAKNRIEQLAEARIILLLRRLKPAQAPEGLSRAKVRESPKVYLAESARTILSTGAIPTDPEIRFRSRMIRTVCALESARRPSSTFRYYGGCGKNHLELIVQTAVKRIGFVFLEENRFNRWSWSYCKRIFRRSIIQGAFVLYPGHRIFFAAERMVVLPTEELCSHYRAWMNTCLGSSRKLLLAKVRAYNATHAGYLS